MAHVLIDIGPSLNVLPKKALDRLDCKALTLKPSNIVVRAFDGSKRMVCCTPKFALPYSSKFAKSKLQDPPRVAQFKGLISSQN